MPSSVRQRRQISMVARARSLALLVAIAAVAFSCQSSGGGGGGGGGGQATTRFGRSVVARDSVIASPKEILDYKLQVIEEYGDELLPEQEGYILYYPGRSFAEIDQAVEFARQEFAAREAARLQAADMGVDIGARRRVTSRVWARDPQTGNFVLERRLPPAATDGDGASDGEGEGGEGS